MERFLGAWIRRERLRQGLSQEGLCRGVCAVSYLSKIEQGKAQAGEDILLPLLRRLGIDYEADAGFLAQGAETVEALYEELLAGMGALPGFEEKLERLKGQRQRYLASPLMLDVRLLLACRGGEGLEGLEDFVPAMDRRQYALYLLLRLQWGEDTAEELLQVDSGGFYAYTVGAIYYRRGRYLEAVDLLSRAYDLAAREGHVHLMLDAKVFLGNCYSDSGQQALMLTQYQVARRLAAALGDADRVSNIDYNLGSTYLEWGMAEEAYAILQSVAHRDAMCWHKLTIALEKLERREEALSALAAGRAAAVPGYAAEVMGPLLDLVAYRLEHPDYLRDGIYAALMTDTFALLRRTMPSGFVRFHIPYMLEVLEAERRYKEAYQLSREFSALTRLLHD